MTKQEFTGVLYDCYEEIVIERSAVIRATREAAMEDAKALIEFVNSEAEAFDDADGGDTTVGRVDESYCFVVGPDGIEY